MSAIIKQWRYDMFPEIEDWSGEQNQYRHADVKDLDFYHFVWFHPIAYTIMKLAIPSWFLFLFTIISVRNAKYGLSWSLYIPLVVCIFCLYLLFRDIMKLDILLETNMYDILMKD